MPGTYLYSQISTPFKHADYDITLQDFLPAPLEMEEPAGRS